MKTGFVLALAGLCATSLLGCKEIRQLKGLVGQVVEIEATSEESADTLAMEGRLKFTDTYHFTSYRTECDQVVCGSEEVYRCEETEDCRTSPNGHYVCRKQETCGYETVPQYCDVNCREVPYADSSRSHTYSQIGVKLVGVTQEQAKNIKEIALGVRTNGKFQKLVAQLADAKPAVQALFRDVHADSNTLVALKAKGFRLKAGQDFLRLNGFTRGANVEITLEVEPTGTDKVETSVLGSSENFPELKTDSWE